MTFFDILIQLCTLIMSKVTSRILPPAFRTSRTKLTTATFKYPVKLYVSLDAKLCVDALELHDAKLTSILYTL